MPAANLNSPRSAIIDTRSSSSSPSDKMASTGGVEVDKAASSGTENPGPSAEVDGGADPEQKKNDGESGNAGNEKKNESRGGVGSPTQSMNSYPQGYPSHLTPQQGYYMAYQSQVTPEPPSPAGYGPGVYDVGSFFQQPAGFQNSLYPGGAHQQGQHPPGSPSQSGSMSGIPPASPLFPRLTGQATQGLLDQHRMLDPSHGDPLSPAPAYLASPHLGPSAAGPAAMYQNMYAVHGSASSNSPDEYPGWTDSRNHQNAYHNIAQGIPIPYVPGMPTRSANAANRSYSFEEAMLPPSVMSDQNQQDQQGNPAYSPYSGSNQQNGMGAAGTLFAHQQPWGYGGPPPDTYTAPGSPLQARPTHPQMGYPGRVGPGGHMAPQHMGMGPYGGGQFYPATSPGPPIQTTTSNKGPDGANLFIFHIPNHFTNLDMYQLFCPYGNLLSVRIMVEKDTGRSRGFGFVSYDTPDAAALAIKELNGFAIGNKRLKVQHKQIRPSDHHGRDQDDDGGFHVGPPDGSYGRGHMPQSLPPSGPNAMNAAWYNRASVGPTHVDVGVPEQQQQSQQQQEEGGTSETIPGVPPADAVFADPNQSAIPSPLSNMEALHQTLPEVGGAGGE